MGKMSVACPTCGITVNFEDPTIDQMPCPNCGRKIVFGKKSEQ